MLTLAVGMSFLTPLNPDCIFNEPAATDALA
jgi:hypothetical protein